MKNLYLLVLLIFGNNTFSMIIDNLDDKRANWSAISDNVMGGISEVNFYEVERVKKNFIDLKGLLAQQIMAVLFNLLFVIHSMQKNTVELRLKSEVQMTLITFG